MQITTYLNELLCIFVLSFELRASFISLRKQITQRKRSFKI